MKSLTPNLMVEDVNESIKFYKEKLWFETVMTVPETWVFDRAMIKNWSVNIMLQKQDNMLQEYPVFKWKNIGSTASLYINIDDVSWFYEKVKDQVILVNDLHKTFYGALEFAMEDRDWYILVFAQSN